MNARQSLFVEEYLKDLNATQAAIRAGYSAKTAESQGSRLLTNVKIKKAIKALRERIQTENIATIVDIEEFLSKSMFGKVDEEVVVTVGDGDGYGKVVKAKKEISAKDRIKAAELLGKRHGMWTERHEIDANLHSSSKLDSILNQLTDDGDG